MLFVFAQILSFSLVGFSQSDTLKNTNRASFGWFVGGGISKSDFSELKQTPYFLNYPNNLYVDLGATIYIGNPDKLFLVVPFKIIIPKKKKTHIRVMI